MTTFIVWAPIPPAQLGEQLGRPEYSYGFVLARFRPLLEKLGTVIEVADPAVDVDPIFHACEARGDECHFLVFAPPHRAPTGLLCPTTTVFAWEFETIPDEQWDGDSRNDWRTVLADHGRAIVLSQHSVDAVRRSMGEDFPVVAVPAPVFDRFRLPPLRCRPPLDQRSITVAGTVIDSREFTYTDDGLTSSNLAGRLSSGAWGGETIEMETGLDGSGADRLLGFYHPERWGTWTRVAAPAVMLPVSVQGPVEVVVTAHGLGRNAGRTVRARLGDSTADFVLPRRRRDVRVHLNPQQPAAVLHLEGLLAEPPGGLDERTMGVGLVRLTIRRPSLVPPRVDRWMSRGRRFPPSGSNKYQTVSVSGVLYTSVLNPVDHRKNWPAMITAFCWAFRDEPSATLLLKMTHHSLAAYFSEIQDVLHRVGPTQCRVVVVHGFLPDDQFERLIDVTTYYANASSAEGLCMPLMEFMSAGVPAVATDNTALADYVTPDSTFIVRSSPGYTHWPHDNRRMIRAVEHRVDWQSLTDQLTASFDVAVHHPDDYGSMAVAARSQLSDFCRDSSIGDRLMTFLNRTVSG